VAKPIHALEKWTINQLRKYHWLLLKPWGLLLITAASFPHFDRYRAMGQMSEYFSLHQAALAIYVFVKGHRNKLIISLAVRETVSLTLGTGIYLKTERYISPSLRPGQCMRDLWWTKWRCDRFFSGSFSFPCQYYSTEAP
jgi:hypothetical protein